MANAKVNGSMLVQLALGLFLIVLGIYGIQSANGSISSALSNALGANPGAEIQRAMVDIFGRDLGKVIAIIIAVVELAAGIFLILEFLVLKSSSITNLLLFIVLIFWIVYMVYVNIILGLFGGKFNFKTDILPWLYAFSINLLVLAGLFGVWKRRGN